MFTTTSKIVKLTNVLFVPKLGVNLLSLYNLINKGINLTFNLTEGLIYKGDKLLATGNYANKVATFSTYSNKNKVIVNTDIAPVDSLFTKAINNTNAIKDTITLHKRLGHPSLTALGYIPNNCNSSINFIDSKCEPVKNCITCVESKITKHVSKDSINTIVEKFSNLVYLDIGGPILPIAIGNYRYY